MDTPQLKVEDPVGRHSGLVRPWIWAVLVAVVALATYAPALAGDFVWDDVQLIEQSPTTKSVRPIQKYFLEPFWEADSLTPGRNLYYRPVVAMSYSFDYAIHGPNSAGFRLTNYAFHLANIILLFSLLIRMGCSGFAAALMSATWGILPRLTENVAWISGRTDVFAATGVLAALLVWGERWRQLGLAAVFLMFGLFCKEVALAGLMVIVALELIQGSWRNGHTLRRIAAITVPALLWLGLKIRVSGLFPRGTAHQTFGVRVMTFLEAVGRYATMIFDWLRPRAEIGVMGEPNTPFAILGVFVLIVASSCLIFIWPRTTNWGKAALLGAIAAIAPVIHLVQLTIDVNAADRFLYVPLALLVLAMSTFTALRQSRVMQSGLAVVLLTSLPITIARAKSWIDPLTLWSDELRTSHGQCRTCRLELAKIQADAGDFMPSLRMLQGLLRNTIRQGNAPTLVALDLSMLYTKLGDYDRAKLLLLDLLKAQPDVPKYWRELATTQAARSEFQEAEFSAKQALRLMPSYENAKLALVVIDQVRREAPRMSDPAVSKSERARFLAACGRTREAENMWLDILASNPTPNEIEGGLNFVMNLGSSAAVSTLVDQHAELLHAFPQLEWRLRGKLNMHVQLAHLNLVR